MVQARNRSKKKKVFKYGTLKPKYRLLIYNGSSKEQVQKKKSIQVWYSKTQV